MASGLALALCGLALASSARADGKLDRARDEMRGDDDDRNTDEHDGGGWAAELVGGFFEALFSDDASDDRRHGDDSADVVPPPPALDLGFGYSRYPYERPDAAYVLSRGRELAYAPQGPRSDVEPELGPLHAQEYAGQLAVEGGYWAGLHRAGLSGRLLTASRVELDARGYWLHEPASDSPNALLGDAHLGLRFAQTDALLLRLGIGLRFWSDAEIDEAGLDGILGMDWFPARPFVVSAQLGGGHLGQAPVGNARVQLGVSLQRLELLAGVEWLRIGDVDLSSPIAGLRLWL